FVIPSGLCCREGSLSLKCCEECDIKARWSILERHIDQQLLAMHIHNVAEGTIAAPSKVEAYTALPYLQISDMQLIEKIGQHRINDVQFFPVSARTNSQDRSQ